eukprot:356808-Chlamydomonas_euryale.AAC.2
MLDWAHVLSSGEQQRVAFLRLLRRQPRLAFLDEVGAAVWQVWRREGEAAGSSSALCSSACCSISPGWPSWKRWVQRCGRCGGVGVRQQGAAAHRVPPRAHPLLPSTSPAPMPTSGVNVNALLLLPINPRASAPLLPSLPLSLSPSFPRSLPHSLSPFLSPYLTGSLTCSLPHSLPPSFSHSLPPIPPYVRPSRVHPVLHMVRRFLCAEGGSNIVDE